MAAAIVTLLATGKGPGLRAEEGSAAPGVAFLVSGSAFVPARFVFEWLGARVEYQGKVVTARRGEDRVDLTVGETRATRNGVPVTLQLAPVIVQARTYVPLRFVAEAFGAEVAYDTKARRVSVASEGRVLSLPVYSGDPVHVGCEAFRAFLRAERSYDNPTGKNVVLFEADRYAWIRALGTYDRDLHTWAEDERVERDPRFATVLKENGGRPGDKWYPYTIRRPAATHTIVAFPEWNWSTWVDVKMGPAGWEAVRIEGNGEGNEGNPPLRWRVERVGNQLKVSREE